MRYKQTTFATTAILISITIYFYWKKSSSKWDHFNQSEQNLWIESSVALPNCTHQNVGQAFYIESKKELRFCNKDKKWELGFNLPIQQTWKDYGCKGTFSDKGTEYNIDFRLVLFRNWEVFQHCHFAKIDSSGETESKAFLKFENYETMDPKSQLNGCEFDKLSFESSPKKRLPGIQYITVPKDLCKDLGTKTK